MPHTGFPTRNLTPRQPGPRGVRAPGRMLSPRQQYLAPPPNPVSSMRRVRWDCPYVSCASGFQKILFGICCLLTPLCCAPNMLCSNHSSVSWCGVVAGTPQVREAAKGRHRTGLHRRAQPAALRPPRQVRADQAARRCALALALDFYSSICIYRSARLRWGVAVCEYVMRESVLRPCPAVDELSKAMVRALAEALAGPYTSLLLVSHLGLAAVRV